MHNCTLLSFEVEYSIVDRLIKHSSHITSTLWKIKYTFPLILPHKINNLNSGLLVVLSKFLELFQSARFAITLFIHPQSYQSV